MTIGEKRIRTKFNPSANTLVDKIKHKSAELIDDCETEKAKSQNRGGESELIRLWALAQTHYEIAAMWAVKAATGREE